RWTVDATYGTYKILISDTTNSADNDSSDEFEIVEKYLIVSGPNDKSVYTLNEEFKLTWESIGGFTGIKIQLYKGSIWQTTIREITEDDRNEPWIVDWDVGRGYRIGISGISDVIGERPYESYSIFFEIKAPAMIRNVRIIKPKSPWENVYLLNCVINKTYIIQWESTSDISYVNIFLIQDPGTKIIRKFQNITNNGEYIWTVNETRGEGYYILVQAIGYATQDDTPVFWIDDKEKTLLPFLASGFEAAWLVLGLIACVFLLYRRRKLKKLGGGSDLVNRYLKSK
ncbi:MAG: hypothetical protein ACFFDI_22055, partial [Promethearchaeota archaeon]